jgi:hypothetical protein
MASVVPGLFRSPPSPDQEIEDSFLWRAVPRRFYKDRWLTPDAYSRVKFREFVQLVGGLLAVTMGFVVAGAVILLIGDVTNAADGDEFGPFNEGILIGGGLVGLAWLLYYWGGKEEPLRGYVALTPEEYMRDERPWEPDEEDAAAS